MSKIDNSYPSLEGLEESEFTPRQKRVSKVSFVIAHTGDDSLGMTGIALRGRSGDVRVTRMKLTGREKFLLNELMLDFYERRKGRV